jgi:CheY-like chemotaxis protein/anti-sigma regulatory factor (Ser/Thr protein kinase)
VQADATELHQVIMNLCTNAYQALPDGKGRVALTLFAEPPSDDPVSRARVCLRVSDDGAGMTPEVLQRCCDPYFTTKEAGRGTGMGLAIVHGVVVSLGGTVTIDSAPGQGTTVLVGLPAADAPAEVAVEPAPPTGRAAAPFGARIMVVEDEAAILGLQTKVLERAGYQVEGFGDPRQALEAFGREPAGFDLIITDQTMPGLTGADLTREALAIRPDMPVVVCSGFSTAFTPEMASALGARAYLHKPLDIAGFTAAVAGALSGSGEA